MEVNVTSTCEKSTKLWLSYPSVCSNSHKCFLDRGWEGKTIWVKTEISRISFYFYCVFLSWQRAISILYTCCIHTALCLAQTLISPVATALYHHSLLCLFITHLHSVWSHREHILCYKYTQRCLDDWCTCGRTPVQKSIHQCLQVLKGYISIFQLDKGALMSQQSWTQRCADLHKLSKFF